MFKRNDFVVHSGHGLCTVLDVNPAEGFYKLETYHNKMLIKMPIEKASIFLRPMLDKAAILKAINDSILLSDDYIKDNKERKVQFQSLVISNDIMDTLLLLKLLYHISEDKRAEKKTLGSFDTQFLQQAERKLFNEIAVALNMSKDDARALVLERLKAQPVY